MLRNIYIIGMGALGVFYGHLIEKKLSAAESLKFIADADRIARYSKKTITCNGEVCNFSFADAAIPWSPYQPISGRVPCSVMEFPTNKIRLPFPSW